MYFFERYCMKVYLKDIEVGMILKRDINSNEGQTVIPKGTIFTASLIEKLENFNLDYVEIDTGVEEEEEDPFDISFADDIEINFEDPFKTSSADQNIFNVTVTNEFNEFKEEQIHNQENLSFAFESLLSDSNADHSVAIIDAIQELGVELQAENSKNVNLLDMIYGMRGHSDAVYMHSLNVGMIAGNIGKWLGFPEEEVQTLITCGLFHDIGKLLVPKHILEKNGPLNAMEYAIMQTHAVKGYELLNKFNNIDDRVKKVALYHHERCDGSGYPSKLKDKDIDKYSKIIAIADVYDAMTSERKYRHAICPFKVAADLEKDGLHKFDTEYVLTFLNNMLSSYLQSKVRLSDGRIGRVIKMHRFHKSKPLIEMEDGSFIDLANEINLSIEEII